MTQWQRVCLACKKPEFLPQNDMNLAWERTLVSPSLGRTRESQEFKVIPGYVGNLRTA